MPIDCVKNPIHFLITNSLFSSPLNGRVEIADEVLDSFRSCTSITHLALHHCYFSGEALQQLVATLKLDYLHLEGNAELLPSNVEVMSGYLRSLRYLNLNQCHQIDVRNELSSSELL